MQLQHAYILGCILRIPPASHELLCRATELQLLQPLLRHAIDPPFPVCRQHVHPSKVALHAAAYAAAPQLTTPAHQHDAASAIVRCALRSVAARCEASPSARLSCLNTLSQLDRLRPGSRSEAKSGQGIVPRMRGDIHADITAAALSFTFLHSRSRDAAREMRAQHLEKCPMCKYAATHLVTDAPRTAAAPAALDLASSNASSSTPSSPCTSGSSREAPGTDWLAPDGRTPRRSCSGQNIVARTLCRLSHRRCPFSRQAGKGTATASPRSADGSLYAASAPSSLASPLTHATHALRGSEDGQGPAQAVRRWELLRRHVRLMALETGLRQSMWHAAVAAACSSEHSAQRADSCSLCAASTSESNEVCGQADPAVWTSGGERAQEGAAEQAAWADGQCIAGQICGQVAAC